MRIKTMCIILCLFILSAFPLFSAGKSEDGAGTDTGLKPVKLTWYYPGSYPQNDQEAVFEAVNEGVKEAINATVDFKATGWGDYDQKMQVTIASGEPFDLCFTANWMNNYHQNVSKGAFLPLDDLLTEYAPNLWGSVPEKIWRATKVDGEIYGIINYQISAMTNGVSFKKELVDKYKFEYQDVDSLEDFEPFMEALKKYEPSIIPIDVHNHSGYMLGLVNAYLGFDEIGGRAIPGVIQDNNPALEVVNQFKTEAFKDWLNLMRSWAEKGYIREDALTVTDSNPEKTAGKFGIMYEGNLKPGVEAEFQARHGYPVYSIPISESVLYTSSIISTMHAISITSNNPERAMMFMELMNTDKVLYNTLTFGIEDKHYKKTGPNRIELIPDTGYNPGTAWMHASTFNAYLIPGQSDDVWERTKEINENATPSVLLGFSFNPVPVQSEIAQCSSVVKEYLPALECGQVDIDRVLPDFLNKLDKAGADTIIAEMQKQIDAWKK